MAHLNISFARSKFARHIFLLFISSAVIPIVVIAFLSFSHVSKQLREQSYEQSRQTSKAIGMQLFDRFILLGTELEAIAEGLPVQLDTHRSRSQQVGRDFSSRFTDLAVVLGADEQINLVGTIDHQLTLTNKQQQHLALGENILYTHIRSGTSTDILMIRLLDHKDLAKGKLVGIIEPDYLWDVEDVLPDSGEMLVLSPSKVVIYATDPLHAADLPTLETLLSTSTTGHFAWREGEAVQLASFWSLFTEAEFGLSYLTIVVSQSEYDALAPIVSFKSIYVPALILAILGISFVATTQIRKKLAPLVTLMDATRRIATGDFNSRISVTGDDELGHLGEAFNSMASRLGKQFTSLATMAEIDQLILSTFDARYIIATVLGRAGELTPCSVAAILAFDEDQTRTGQLSVRFNESGAVVVEERVFLSHNDIQQLNDHYHGLMVDCSSGYPPYVAALVQGEVCSVLLLPLITQKRLAAVILLSYTRECEVCEEDLEPLRKFADHVSVALSNASWEERLYHQAHYDTLTNLPNRALLKDRLEQAIARAQRNGSYVGVAFLDLDRFKLVNDSLGHTVGDLLLKETANLLTNSVRSVDTVVRFGGDEFVVIIPDIDHKADIVFELGAIADKILETTRHALMLENNRVYTEMSIGIAMYPRDGATPDALVKNADTAMYHAKEQGRGNYQFFSPELNAATLHRLNLENELRLAIENNEFEVFYQAKVDSASGYLVGAEALIRWNHPERGIVPPIEFIGVAEETGQIRVIGEWMIRSACSQTKAWLDAGFTAIRVAVNVSPCQFQDEDLASVVSQILTDTQLDPAVLELEVTEGMVMKDIDKSIDTLKRLSDMGIHLSVDDFGTGYSSLSYLRRLPIHTLKIDQSFIQDMIDDRDAEAIVSATIVLAHKLGLSVVAEGVETDAQRRLLQQWRCNELQGYLISKPLPVEKFTQLLRQRQEEEISVASSSDTLISIS
jgi:diguanylate cyclase (GGDEF)-like protein